MFNSILLNDYRALKENLETIATFIAIKVPLTRC